MSLHYRMLLGKAARGDDYKPPDTPINYKNYLENKHICACARQIFRTCKRIPNSPNITTDSYTEALLKIIKYLIPKASDDLIRKNIGCDTILNVKTGLSFEEFFICVLRYAALSAASSQVQDILNTFYGILSNLSPDTYPSLQINLQRPPYKLPLSFWPALVNAAEDIRPCFIISGVNTQRTKLFERILSQATGALLLDIPTLIKWPFRSEAMEEARKKLLKGGALSYNDSHDLILEAAKSAAAMYRGWIIPASFHKDDFDFSTLFPNYSDFEQRCFCIEMNASLNDLLDLANTRKFDPEDNRIITNLPPSSLAFVQRLKRREFIGRELDDAVEEEEQQEDENQNEEEEDEIENLMLYKAPTYDDPEERGDEAQHLEEEDEGKKRLLTLPEESVEQITKRFNEFTKEKQNFEFPLQTKRVIVDATQPLNEMSNIVCDKTSILVPCAYPDPIEINEEEERPEPKYSPCGENCVVTLVDEKRTVKGSPEISLLFYGFTFQFETKEKMKLFADDPLHYLLEVYHTYHHRVLLLGPRLCGKKTMAKQLSEYFESEIVDFETLVHETRLRIPRKEEEEEVETPTDSEKPEGEDSEATKDENGEEVKAEEKTNADDETEKSETDTATDYTSYTETETTESKTETSEATEETKPTETEGEQAEGEEPKEKKEGEEEDKKENGEEEDGEKKPKKKPKKKREPLPPIYENGYISIIPEFTADKLHVFQENEAMAPEVLIVLKMNPDKDLLTKRLQSALLESGVEESASELVIDKIVESLEPWNEQLNEFTEAIREYGIQVQTVEASLPLDEVFWNCAYLIDSLLPRTSDPTEEEPKFGYLGPYCPVTLKEKHLLQSNADLTLFYDGALFGFADETAQERFRNAPLAFIGALPIVPPPRILIVGTRGSGKTSIAHEIGRIHNAPVYEIPQNPKFEPVNEEEEEPDPEETTRQTMEPFLKKIMEETENQTKGWIIEGTPKSSVGASMMLEMELKPDFVIELEQNEQWVLMRNRRRLNDDEQILQEEGDDQGPVKEFSAVVAEATSKGEPVVIDTSRRFTSTMQMINRVCQRELAMRKSLFLSQSAEPVEESEEESRAKLYLKEGKAFISQFGRYCPCCIHQNGALVLTDLSISCTFLGRIFFFETEKHRQLFMDDPLTFVLNLHPPVFPFVPRVSVLGNSELAQRIATSINAEFIRPRDVIARVAKHPTTFGAKVRQILAQGKAVDAAIFRTALKAVLSRHDCQVRGFVLDGYPTKLSELLAMREDGFMPHDIVTVKADEQMINHAVENFHNVIQITDEPTVWMMTINATNRLNYNMRQRWESLLAMDEKRAYSVSAMDISPEEVASNLTDFRHYCPITYVADGIAAWNEPSNWENIVKWEGKFYHLISSEYRNTFLISPVPFVRMLSDRSIQFAEVAQPAGEPEHEGYDVIELSAGKFTQGQDSFVANYEGKIFRFITQENRIEFCKNTDRYLDVPLPEHRPVAQPQTQTPVGSMPPVAFLEQSVGDVVTECIVELTQRRPKIPGKSMEQSMNEYVYTYIRANSKDIGDLLHDRFVDQMTHMNKLVELAETLKKSLETPMEERNMEEHEKLCALWNETYNKK